MNSYFSSASTYWRQYKWRRSIEIQRTEGVQAVRDDASLLAVPMNDSAEPEETNQLVVTTPVVAATDPHDGVAAESNRCKRKKREKIVRVPM